MLFAKHVNLVPLEAIGNKKLLVFVSKGHKWPTDAEAADFVMVSGVGSAIELGYGVVLNAKVQGYLFLGLLERSLMLEHRLVDLLAVYSLELLFSVNGFVKDTSIVVSTQNDELAESLVLVLFGRPIFDEFSHLLVSLDPSVLILVLVEVDVESDVEDVEVVWFSVPLEPDLVGGPMSLPDSDPPVVVLARDHVEALLIEVLLKMDDVVLLLHMSKPALLVGMLEDVKEVDEALDWP